MIYMSASRIRAWQACHRQYYLRYVRKIEPAGPPPQRLVAGVVLHAALALCHTRPTDDDAGALAAVHAAAEGLAQDYPAEVLALARDEVAPLVMEYVRRREALGLPATAECERWLRASAGPLTLVARADAIWPHAGDGACVVDWKTSEPTTHALGTQMSFLHAGLRADGVAGPIRHLVVSFRPDLVAREYHLDEDTFRAAVRLAYDTAREVAAEQRWRPSPGDACASCDYALSCSHAIVALEAATF